MACIAIVSIPPGTQSVPFLISEIHTNGHDDSRGNVKINFPLQIGITGTGEMQPVHPITGIFWPKLIDIAYDCHDQNVKLCRWSNNENYLILQATREILGGHRLRLWFSEELMVSELGIPPYLSPCNIKGGNSYVCHECQEEFERPNLLKLHLALHCDRLSPDTIWNRLKSIRSTPLLRNSPYIGHFSPVSNMSLLSSTRSSHLPLLSLSPTCPPSILSTTPSSVQHHSVCHHNVLPIPNSDPSHNNNNKGHVSPSTLSPTISIDAPVSLPSPAGTEREGNGRNLVVQEQHHHHARLEAIVSNMGKAKNGHVCLYCGKLYSRKYGLKIHIRTHTGYKPLRCKICHRPFGDPSNLNKHVRLHSDGSTPYRCELCSKVLVRKRDLDRHMRARHGASSQLIARSANTTIALHQQRTNASHTSTVTSSISSSSRL